MSDPLEAWFAALPEGRAAEARRLDAIFRAASGFAPWLSGRIVGYGRYDYRYASGRTGTSLATGFSARPRDIAIYILPGTADFADIRAGLGPHRMGKACLTITRLDRIDAAVLERLIRAGLEDLARHWPVQPT